MKKITLSILLSMITIFVLFSQTPCENNSNLHEYYEKDIKHLALIEMENENAPELALAEIPSAWQLPIFEGLSAIYNSNSIGRNEVFDIYCVHHENNTSNNSLRIFQTMNIRPDTSVSWLSNWENEDLNTYNDEFNSFLERWEFEYEGFIPIINTFKIKTSRLINMIPLADTIDMMDSIIFAERQSYIGGGNLITYQKEGNDRFYKFGVGWGDCSSGCINYHFWDFMVSEDCDVFFLGESGNDNIPEWLIQNCDISSPTNIKSYSNPNVKIYPNPTIRSINIELNDLTKKDLSYNLSNLLGEVVLSGKLENNISINTNDLTSGMYLLTIRNKNSIISCEKILKI